MGALVLPTITSRGNARVKQLRAAFSGNARLAGGLVGLEGETMLREALRSGVGLRTVFVSERADVPGWLPGGIEVLALTAEVFAGAVDTRQPQGIAALIEAPRWGLEAIAVEGARPLLVVAAGLQDPGNLGTLVRSAEAFGASGVLTTAGTVSAWNQKSLRASAGSVFRVPVVEVTEAELRGLKARGVRLYAAVAEAEGEGAVGAAQAALTGACAVMIGNEGAGLGEEWLALADERVTIPMPGRIESLNAAVAGSVFLYEASRQRAEAAARDGDGRR